MVSVSASPVHRTLRAGNRVLWATVLGGWLVFAFFVFRGAPTPAWTSLAAAAAGLGAIAWLSRRIAPGRFVGTLGQAALEFVLGAAWLHALFEPARISAGLLWLAAAIALGLATSRVVQGAIEGRLGVSPGEPARWSVLLVVATAAVWPVYTSRPNGAGDAYWYVMMLADFVSQTRAGIFPVWIGQTKFAFNGAYAPLHLAPGFQHVGWIVDLATVRSLEFLALKNVVLALAALASAAGSYFCFRAMLRRAGNFALLLAIGYTLSPGLLAPLAIGDQYMTFVAATCLPWALYATWRCLARNDLIAHVMLGASVAGMWICHTPLGLWASIVCAPIYLGKLILRGRGGRPVLLTSVAAVTFLLLGASPFLTAVGLDNVPTMPIVGQQVRDELVKLFPAVLQPVSEAANLPSDYKPGYFALGCGVLGLALLVKRPNWPAGAFAAAALFVAAIVLPTPGFQATFWSHLPALVLKTTNAWAIQRLALIWAALLFFSCAATLAVVLCAATRGRRWIVFGATGLAVAGAAWSWSEARRLSAHLARSVSSPTGWQHFYAEHNVILTRYPYSSFSAAPTYFSHGYMEPHFESRLLTRDTLQPLLDNYAGAIAQGRKVAQGVFTGHSNGRRPFYRLTPEIKLQSGRHYVLKTTFRDPTRNGWFQILGPRLFREYILPDSGIGIAGQLGAPRGYGSLPSSSPYIPLYTDTPGESIPLLNYIHPDDQEAFLEIECAAFELWEYEPRSLPIRLDNLTPYRTVVVSPAAAYLESPRMWLGHYRAKVNGQRVPVLRSPNNLCMVAVTAGTNSAEIKYVPPLHVEIAYWVGVIAWSTLALATLGWLAREGYGPPRGVPEDASAATEV